MEFSCATADVVNMAIAINPDMILTVVIELLLFGSDATKLEMPNQTIKLIVYVISIDIIDQSDLLSMMTVSR
jgi:hypothetical protein